MKLLSIAIPCYNSESYMEKCIESLLVEKTSRSSLLMTAPRIGPLRLQMSMQANIRLL